MCVLYVMNKYMNEGHENSKLTGRLYLGMVEFFVY